MTRPSIKENVQRRSYSQRFKAELVAQVIAEEASISVIARTHGLNANLLQRWVTEYRRHGKHDLGEFESRVDEDVSPAVPTNWIPIATSVADVNHHALVAAPPKRPAGVSPTRTPAQTTTTTTRVAIELVGESGLRLKLDWPNADVADLAQFARTVLT